jgi:predicted transcriptional regulator
MTDRNILGLSDKDIDVMRELVDYHEKYDKLLLVNEICHRLDGKKSKEEIRAIISKLHDDDPIKWEQQLREYVMSLNNT